MVSYLKIRSYLAGVRQDVDRDGRRFGSLAPGPHLDIGIHCGLDQDALFGPHRNDRYHLNQDTDRKSTREELRVKIGLYRVEGIC
jgi:hypothetical protein